MPMPNNTIEFLTSERNKQTPPYRGFYDEAIAALKKVNGFQNGKSCETEGGTFQNGNDHKMKEVVYGKWLANKGYKHAVCFCSICNHGMPFEERGDYCPNCGADMRGNDNE